MRIVIQALIASVVIHLVYVICTIGIGFIQTVLYKPDRSRQLEEVHYLQNEVAFGMVGSPIFLVFTFIGTTLLCGIFIKLFQLKKVDNVYH